MSLVTPLPSENDLATSPELAILAALRVALDLATDTLRCVHPVEDPTCRYDRDVRSAATIICLADTLRVAVVDYEQRMAGLHVSP